jgi:hypothetical protein
LCRDSCSRGRSRRPRASTPIDRSASAR